MRHDPGWYLAALALPCIVAMPIIFVLALVDAHRECVAGTHNSIACVVERKIGLVRPKGSAGRRRRPRAVPRVDADPQTAFDAECCGEVAYLAGDRRYDLPTRIQEDAIKIAAFWRGWNAARLRRAKERRMAKGLAS